MSNTTTNELKPFTFDEEKFRIPNLQNATLPFLADELIEIRKVASFAKKYEGVLKVAINARRDNKLLIEGTTKDLRITHVDGKLLWDGDKIKKDNPTDYHKYQKVGADYNEIHVVDKVPAAPSKDTKKTVD